MTRAPAATILLNERLVSSEKLVEATQDRLLSIAASRFAAEGFAGVSMRSIGRDAGITQAAIYHHFPNKEALYYAAVEHLLAGKQLVLQETIDADLTPDEQLRRLVRDMLSLVRDDPEFRQIYYRALIEADEGRLSELARTIFSEVHEQLEGVMARISPHMDSMMLLTSLSGLVFQHLESIKLYRYLPNARPEHEDPDNMAEHISQLFLYGALPR